MEQTITCPGCSAHLALPVAFAGQSMQCPRCRRTFERAPARVPPPNPQIAATSAEDVDDAPAAQPACLDPRYPRSSQYIGTATMFMLIGNAFAFSLWAYSFFEEGILRVDMVAPGDPRWEAHFRFASRVEEAAPVWLPPTILAFCIWCFWAGGNARALNAAGLLPRVVLVIGMLTCLPIQSYMYLDDLWRSSDPYAIEHPGSWREAPHSWWVRSWGLLCLSSALSTCGVIASDRNAVHPEFESWFAMAACLSIAAASGVLILIVLWIGIRQRMRFARIYGADVE